MTDLVLPTNHVVATDAAVLASDAGLRHLIIRGAVVVVAFFVLLGGWAAVARLDSAAVSPGVVQSDGSRRIVQHPEGGVVSEVLVKEGDFVRQGQVLVRLDQVQARTSAEMSTAAVDTLTAMIARLEAEQAGAPKIAFPASLTGRANDPAVTQLMNTESRLFRARRSDLSGAGGALGEQIGQAQSQATGYTGEIKALDEQYALIQDELNGLKSLYSQGYATKPRLLAMERTAAAMEGQRQDYLANVQRLQFSQSQVRQQIDQLHRDRLSTVSEQLADARGKLADAVQRQAATQAVLERTVLRAPVAGHILGLSAGAGTVVGRGEPILQVIPSDGSSIVEARLKPSEGAHIVRGMKVELRVASAEGRAMPVLDGVVESRSADLLADPKTGLPFYTVKARIAPAGAARLRDAGLGVGTPMQMIVPTGSRTALQYMFGPVADSFRRGLRER